MCKHTQTTRTVWTGKTSLEPNSMQTHLCGAFEKTLCHNIVYTIYFFFHSFFLFSTCLHFSVGFVFVLVFFLFSFVPVSSYFPFHSILPFHYIFLDDYFRLSYILNFHTLYLFSPNKFSPIHIASYSYFVYTRFIINQENNDTQSMPRLLGLDEDKSEN